MAYALQQLLRDSAERYPDKVAVRAREGSLTYDELETRSSQLACLLRERGIRRGDRVGLYFPKSVDSVVGMLGALKAGAVYVPLDPQAPPRRIGYIIGNCAVETLITDRARLQGLPAETRGRLRLTLLTDVARATEDVPGQVGWGALSTYAAAGPAQETIEQDLAYILYTSGSTGEPKGVMLSHRNALTFVDWCDATFGVRADDHLSNHAPLHFDLSVFDIYNGLKAGATVHMLHEEILIFPASVAAFIEERRISVWYSVPSALVALLLHGNLRRRHVEALRLVLFAGEVFPMKYLRQLAETLSGADLYNLYGPTETNVCTYYKVDRARLPFQHRLPIGRPCANFDVFVVGERDAMVGPGEVGELCVRGPAVTNGYWGDGEKTRRMVVPNRWQPNFEEKVYRTGDLVAQAPDGNFDFLGRRDSQIKSRGYRIELGEIEAALYGHPDVKEAAVVAVPDDEIGARIKAFVALNRPGAVTAADLQRHCAICIPRYMIPEVIEFREALPQTSTGKVDRTRLVQAC